MSPLQSMNELQWGSNCLQRHTPNLVEDKNCTEICCGIKARFPNNGLYPLTWGPAGYKQTCKMAKYALALKVANKSVCTRHPLATKMHMCERSKAQQGTKKPWHDKMRFYLDIFLYQAYEVAGAYWLILIKSNSFRFKLIRVDKLWLSLTIVYWFDLLRISLIHCDLFQYMFIDLLFMLIRSYYVWWMLSHVGALFFVIHSLTKLLRA